jgi:hypothetical protein
MRENAIEAALPACIGWVNDLSVIFDYRDWPRNA